MKTKHGGTNYVWSRACSRNEHPRGTIAGGEAEEEKRQEITSEWKTGEEGQKQGERREDGQLRRLGSGDLAQEGQGDEVVVGVQVP